MIRGFDSSKIRIQALLRSASYAGQALLRSASYAGQAGYPACLPEPQGRRQVDPVYSVSTSRCSESPNARIPESSNDERAMARRARERRKRIVGHVAKDFADAERWDLEFWQSQTPEMRLSALVELREDLDLVAGRNRMFDDEQLEARNSKTEARNKFK